MSKTKTSTMSDIVYFIMCHPGTKVSTERIFCLMNKAWASEENSRCKANIAKNTNTVKATVPVFSNHTYDTLLRNV